MDSFLITNRIVFSRWDADDLPLADLLWGEPDVTKFICSSGKFSEEDIADRLKKEIYEPTGLYHPSYELRPEH